MTEDFFSWVVRNDFRIEGKSFQWSHHRYLRALYEDEAREQVIMKGAQVGATIYLLLRLLWWVCANDAIKAALYLPGIELVHRLSKDRLAKLIAQNAALRARLTGNDTLALKQFGSSTLLLLYVGGRSTKDSTPLDVLAADEVRLIESADLNQIEERLSHSTHKVKYWASTCGPPNSDIHARFLRSDQHHFHTRCGCPDGVVLSEVFPECLAVRADEVYLRCPRCGYRIRDPQNGRFLPHNPSSPVRGYHIPQLLSPYMSPREIWDAYQTTDNLQEFYNAKLGVPFLDPRSVGVLPEEVDACLADGIAWNVPGKRDGAIEGRICMGIDQMAGFNYVVTLQQTGTHRRLVRLEVVEADDPFRRCYDLIERDRVDICVVDALPNFNQAAELARAFPRKVFLCWWVANAKELVVWSDRKKHSISFKRTSAQARIPWWTVVNKYSAIELALRQLQSRRIQIPRPEGHIQVIRDARGRVGPVNLYEHFRDHVTSVMRQRREVQSRNDEGKRVHSGDYSYEWVYLRGDPHFLDALTFAVVGAERVSKRMVFTTV